jgi:hypothetical protein
MDEEAWNKAASKISEGHSFSFSFLSEFFAKVAAEAAVRVLKS